MDWQLLINIGATAILAIVGWFVRGNKEQQDRTQRELVELRIKVAQDYVTHAALNDIKSTLVRIEQKLDGKADK